MKQRGWYLLALILLVGGILLMVLGALRENVVFFITPSEWREKKAFFAKAKSLRLGGRVAKDSIVKENNRVTFDITDEKTFLRVVYKGTIPDLFKEDQGIVAEGNFDDHGIFIARQVLAKHDENYMPKEVADKLKEQALWRGK
ncbi:MAG: cytochrome c maturation protein CcmE [Alphaproteobacteria bacterium]|jgi:cytochrome c-type biogenesis protein CcmE|nr:cytochrome c maturation protein CcmE [Alphaproteobacteria bacterium]